MFKINKEEAIVEYSGLLKIGVYEVMLKSCEVGFTKSQNPKIVYMFSLTENVETTVKKESFFTVKTIKTKSFEINPMQFLKYLGAYTRKLEVMPEEFSSVEDIAMWVNDNIVGVNFFAVISHREYYNSDGQLKTVYYFPLDKMEGVFRATKAEADDAFGKVKNVDKLISKAVEKPVTTMPLTVKNDYEVADIDSI